MEHVIDWAFAFVGLISVAIYGGLLYSGAMPSEALLISLGGGVVLGILLRILIQIAESPVENEEDDLNLSGSLVASEAATVPAARATPVSAKAGDGERV